MRAVESDSVKSARKDKLHAARERVSETRERTLHRQEQNRMCMTSKEQDKRTKQWESETFEQTVHRQEQNRMHMATSTITCTWHWRVWHFSTFHFPRNCS